MTTCSISLVKSNIRSMIWLWVLYNSEKSGPIIGNHWPTVYDAGPALDQQWVSCVIGSIVIQKTTKCRSKTCILLPTDRRVVQPVTWQDRPITSFIQLLFKIGVECETWLRCQRGLDYDTWYNLWPPIDLHKLGHKSYNDIMIYIAANHITNPPTCKCCFWTVVSQW